MWGFITVINNTLLPHLRSVFELAASRPSLFRIVPRFNETKPAWIDILISPPACAFQVGCAPGATYTIRGDCLPGTGSGEGLCYSGSDCDTPSPNPSHKWEGN
jgi:hypothetical protein